MTKSLLLKGLAGVAAVGGAVGGGSLFWFKDDIFGGGDRKPAKVVEISKSVDEFTQKDLIDKVGLECGLSDEKTEISDSETKDCNVKTNGTLSIKIENSREDGVTFSSSSGTAKLKVSKAESRSEKVGEKGGTEKYTKDLKFVVESGDLTITKKDGGTTSIQKLEQFETYEIIWKGGEDYFLFRKTEANIGKKNALGLGECEFPDEKSNDRPCSYSDAEKIKKIRFEGQDSGISVTSGTSVSLKVSKAEDTTTFPDGYRFTFTFPSDQTINSKSLKANIPYDFKIKKHDNSNNLTLEKAWSEDKDFTKKAGLTCDGSNKECSVPADSQKLNVKVGTQKKEGIDSIDTTGKIKMETDQPGYNQGLKFTITTADVSLTGGTTPAGSTDITKLEELETYEITEEGGKYYLTRKASRDENIKSSLVLPQDCQLPATGSVQCSLTAEQLKSINFENKDANGPIMASGTATLTISKATNTTDFPLGYRFTLQSEQEITIKNSDIKVKAKIPTDFKIKKNEGKVSLEKAWSDTKFAEKVAMTCDTSSNECSSKTDASGQLNVKKGTDTKTGITSFSATNSGSGKIKVEKDQEGYNQGLKFTVTGGSVTLTGGSKTSDSTNDITTLDEYETYEIKEEGDKYYLTRRDEAIKTIESQLGLKEAGCSLSGSSSSCSLDAEKIKKINFDGKDTNGATLSSGTATLTITSGADTTDFPHGYKFTLKSTSSDITIKNGTNVVKQNISTDFKIKKATGGQSSSLSLEKAWDMTSLGKKVGLSCTNNNSNECSIDNGSGGKLRVKHSVRSTDVKEENLTKKSSSSGNAKIKVTKDQAGYNQGFKFEIEGGNIELEGATASDESDKIKSLDEYETYEIKEDSGKWYLTRKHESIVFLKKQLGFDFCSGDTWTRSGSGSSSSTISFLCDIEKLENLKKIKIHNGSSHSTWPTQDVKVQLEIKKSNSSSSGGYGNLEVEISDSNTDEGVSTICIPDGAGGGVNIKETSTNAKYKISKGNNGGSWCLVKDGNGSSTQCTNT